MKFNLKALFLALCAFTFSLGILKELNFVLNFDTFLQAAFISLATFFVYNLPSQFEFKQKNIVYTLQFTFLLILSYFVIKTYLALIILVFTFLISFFYVSSFPFLKIKIRKIPYLKSFLISISWTSACVIFPLLNNFANIHLNLMLSIFCFFLALTIPFDIRDFDQDQGKIKTIVGKIGMKNSKFLAVILLILAFLCTTFSHEKIIQLILISMTFIYFSILILLTKKNFSSKNFEYLLDGSIILYGLSYFI